MVLHPDFPFGSHLSLHGVISHSAPRSIGKPRKGCFIETTIWNIPTEVEEPTIPVRYPSRSYLRSLNLSWFPLITTRPPRESNRFGLAVRRGPRSPPSLNDPANDRTRPSWFERSQRFGWPPWRDWPKQGEHTLRWWVKGCGVLWQDAIVS